MEKEKIQICINLLNATLGQGITPQKADTIVLEVINLLEKT